MRLLCHMVRRIRQHFTRPRPARLATARRRIDTCAAGLNYRKASQRSAERIRMGPIAAQPWHTQDTPCPFEPVGLGGGLSDQQGYIFDTLSRRLPPPTLRIYAQALRRKPGRTRQQPTDQTQGTNGGITLAVAIPSCFNWERINVNQIGTKQAGQYWALLVRPRSPVSLLMPWNRRSLQQRLASRLAAVMILSAPFVCAEHRAQRG